MRIPKNTNKNALKLAATFSRCLAEGVEPKKWAKYRATQMACNASDRPCCTAHDWCDANIVMMEAFERLKWWHPVEVLDEFGSCEAAFDGDLGQLLNRGWSLADRAAWNWEVLEAAAKIA